MANKIILTDDQKQFLRDNFKTETNLIILTQKCFDDDTLDGRSREGRAVRKFLSENDMQYETKQHSKVEDIELTDGQKEFILDNIGEGLSSTAIANLIFKGKKLTPLCKESRTVLAYIKENSPEGDIELELTDRYVPPKAISRVLKKINDACDLELEESKINRQTVICVEKLRKNLSNSRYVEIMSNLRKSNDRLLFEDEFVRLTWEKPDLTPEDISLYFNLCKEILNLEVCSRHLERLKDDFDKTADSGDGEETKKLSMTLAEIIKTKNDEYHKLEGRIESLIKKLQRDRSDRLKDSHDNNASILSLVRAFQDEAERKVMLEIAEKTRLAVKEEAHRIEAMPDFKARVLGIGVDDVL
tara:strand:+ start:433 stop:1506 length:1074 start_codon:yes stop_codon:yes gene_type:complete